MKIVKNYLTNGQYQVEEYTKKSIFLHHTIGLSTKSAWRWWNHTPDRVGTPYIIDLDGVITECFDPRYWAWHLGVKGDDNFHEKHSINIELVSGGPLRMVGDEFRFYPIWPNKTHFTVIPPSGVTKLKEPWRGHEYYHKYTTKQMKALNDLLMLLYQDFPSIGYEQDSKTFFEYNPSVLNKHIGGIWSHSTVRKDKNDIYPDRRLIRVIKNVKDFQVNLNKPIAFKEGKVSES